MGRKVIIMEIIKKLRKELGLTQEQLGNSVGESKEYIADLESGRRDIKGISAETLVKLAAELGTQAEYIVNPPEHLNDEDFKWDKVFNCGNDDDYWLVVDYLSYSNKLNQDLFCIDGSWYKMSTANCRFTKSVPINNQLILLKNVPENLEPNKDIIKPDYFMYRCIPKEGIDIKLGREITKTELDEIIYHYNLTNSDITNELVAQTGAEFGKYMKTYTAIQVRVGITKDFDLAKKMHIKGIECSNMIPGRVTIRTK